MTLARTSSVAVMGVEGQLVEIQADLADGLPGVTMIGLPDAALQEARDRIRAAIVNSGESWPTRRMTLALLPATLPKRGSMFDVALAVAVLAAAGAVPVEPLADVVLLGELGLDGRLRPTRGTLPAVMAASRAGMRRVLVPAANLAEAALVPGLDVRGVVALADLLGFLRGEPDRTATRPSPGRRRRERPAPDLRDVVGQSVGRRAVEIAAAGGHHLLFAGPPGSGKTMLAERLPGVLPPLQIEEALEVSAVHSVAGLLPADSPLVRRPPYQAPHHTASAAALVGGGSVHARPGAASLSHRGVLFLDEAPEFQSGVLDALRQPLESGEVAIARSGGVARYPARFQLVLAANPCPCAAPAGGGVPVHVDGQAALLRSDIGPAAGPDRPAGLAAAGDADRSAGRVGGGGAERRSSCPGRGGAVCGDPAAAWDGVADQRRCPGSGVADAVAAARVGHRGSRSAARPGRAERPGLRQGVANRLVDRGPGRRRAADGDGRGRGGPVAQPVGGGMRRRPSAAEVRLARAWLSRAVEPGRGAVFNLVTEVGPVEAARLLRSGSADGAVAALVEARRREDRAAEDLAEAARIGGRLVTPEDDEWPDAATWAMQIAYARERAERAAGEPARDRVELAPPLALWVLGAARLDEVLTRAVSIVGSRSATPYGEHVSADLAHGLALRRWTVVSGGAFGIDGAAHRGALAGAGATVAVVAGGLRDPYPRGHAGLFRRIARDGMLISEFPPDATPQRHRFLVRNRLIAGLTAGTVVVEAGVRSGALATGRQALRMGRAVMAVPGPVTSAESAGVHELLRSRPDVTLVTRTAEIVELVGAIGADLAPRPEAPATVRDGLEPLALQVLDGVPTAGAVSPDRIAVAAGVPPLDVLRCLPGLEVRGLVEDTPAGWQLTPLARGTPRSGSD